MEAGKTFITGNNRNLIITQNFIDHMKAHPVEEALLGEATRLIHVPDQKWFVGAADLGRVIGTSGCLEVDPIDIDTPALFGFRHNRRIASRCVRGEGKPTQHITIVARKGKYQDFFFVSAWPGVPAKPEPTHTTQKENMAFWCEHALIWSESNFENKPFMSTWRDVLRNRR